jgi:hypothetical protein
MHAAATELDEEEHVESLQADGLDREKVDREHAVRCVRRKSRQETPLRSPAGSKPASLSSFRTVVTETGCQSGKGQTQAWTQAQRPLRRA